MYLAMNRFQVAPGAEHDFEQMWLTRESHLRSVPGFVAFNLLRGPAGETSDGQSHTLYASHTVWEDHASFEAWTRSEQFRAAHGSTHGARPLTLGHPQFEGFESLQTITKSA
jgi:heme-degrading monooxygenase HmoA